RQPDPDVSEPVVGVLNARHIWTSVPVKITGRVLRKWFWYERRERPRWPHEREARAEGARKEEHSESADLIPFMPRHRWTRDTTLSIKQRRHCSISDADRFDPAIFRMRRPAGPPFKNRMQTDARDKDRPVGLEFAVTRRQGAGRGPYSRRPTARGSDPQGVPGVYRRTSGACGPPATRESGPRCSKPGTRHASVPGHGHSRTVPGRGILAASSRSGAPRRGVTGAHAARS